LDTLPRPRNNPPTKAILYAVKVTRIVVITPSLMKLKASLYPSFVKNPKMIKTAIRARIKPHQGSFDKLSNAGSNFPCLF